MLFLAALVPLLAAAWWPLVLSARWMGKRALAAERADRALTYFQLADRLAPNSRETAIWSARAARQAGDIRQFQRYWDQALRSGCPTARLGWERDLFEAQSGRLFQPSSLAPHRSIEQHLRHVISASPAEEELPAREALAKGLVQSYRFAEAQLELEAWMKRSPDSFRARLWQAELLIRIRSYPRAIDLLQEAIRLNPGSDPARIKLAEALHANGQSAEAIPLLERYLDAAVPEAEPLTLLARCLMDRGDMASARQCVERACQASAEDAGTLALRAQMDLAEGRLEQALEWARMAVEKGPREMNANHLLAQVLAHMGDSEQAAVVRDRVAEIRKDWDDFDQAQKDILRDPLNPDPRVEAGRILARNHSPGEGIRWILSALAIDSDHLASHRALAEIYGEMGESELAERHQKRGRHVEDQVP